MAHDTAAVHDTHSTSSTITGGLSVADSGSESVSLVDSNGNVLGTLDSIKIDSQQYVNPVSPMAGLGTTKTSTSWLPSPQASSPFSRVRSGLSPVAGYPQVGSVVTIPKLINKIPG